METSPHKFSPQEFEALRRHVEAHPNSPLLSALADLYLHDGMPATALKTVEAGLATYPDSPAALLAAAKANILLRRYNDARAHLDRLLDLVPGSGAAASLLEELKSLELRFPPTPSVMQSDPIPPEPEVVQRQAKARKRWSWDDHIIGGATSLGFEAAPLQASETYPGQVDEDEDGRTTGPEPDLEYLAQQLEGARIPPLPEAGPSLITPEAPVQVDAAKVHARPVTETLARIYEDQKKYAEAIAAYKELRDRHPERTYEFTLKIIEIERLDPGTKQTPTE